MICGKCTYKIHSDEFIALMRSSLIDYIGTTQEPLRFFRRVHF